MDFEKEFQQKLIEINTFPSYTDNIKDSDMGFSSAHVDRMETNLIKNFSFELSKFDSAVSSVNIADYKKIFIDLNKIREKKLNKKERKKFRHNGLNSPFNLPFDYNFLFSFGIDVCIYPELFLDAVFIDNTNPLSQKIYAFVGNDEHFIVPFNKTPNGMFCARNTFGDQSAFLEKKTYDMIEFVLEGWIRYLSVFELEKHPTRYNSFRFK